MAIIERRNKGGGVRFQVKVRDPHGNWYPTPAFSSREEAMAEELRLLKAKKKGAAAVSSDAKTFTVQEYWEVWSVENRGGVSAGWKMSQDQMYRDYIGPVIGGLKLKDVGSPEIGRVLNRAVEQGRSEQTRVHIYTLLRTMFRDAVEYYEILMVSPVKAVFHRVKVKRVERTFLHPAQLRTLLQAARTHPWLGPPVWIECLAALRKEAVQALLWPAVQWDQNQILICRAYKAKEKVLADYPKGKDWEYVPMMPPLKAYLWEHYQRSQDKQGFVCQSPRGGMLKYDGYLAALKRLCRQAGLPEVTPHELRHSCTELFVRAGASAEDIRRLLNQKSLTATKTYLHRTDERGSELAVTAGNQLGLFPNPFPNGNKAPYGPPPEEGSVLH